MKIELEKPIHQRFDLLTKLVGVILVANGINTLRYGELDWALFYVITGIIISLLPLHVKMKEP